MPRYDLRCASCKNEFNATASISDRTEGRINCPKCGSTELEAVFKAANYSIKSNSSGECPNRHICGAGCSHA